MSSENIVKGQIEENHTSPVATTPLKATKENVLAKTVGLTINLFSHIFISITVFVCLSYSCLLLPLSTMQLHIVFCVLGYQFFMCEGILVLSKSNSWSSFLRYSHKRNIHWIAQMIGASLATAGSVVIIKEKHENFDTAHGILGFCALSFCFMSLINGVLVKFIYPLNKFVKMRGKWLKVSHFISGALTLILASISLCYGFDKTFFREWATDGIVTTLIVITMIFTSLIIFDRIYLMIRTRITNL